MWTPNHSIEVGLYGRPADMRKSYDGLSALVRRAMQDNPLNGALFVFVNRRKTQMKALYFGGDGYCIWSKRLERGRFQVRFDSADKAQVSLSTLKLLIDGIALDSVRRVRRYRADLHGKTGVSPV
jgi:transposase